MMKDDTRAMFTTPLKTMKNFTITVILWTYYSLGFVVFFSPFYLYALVFSSRREAACHRWHQWFNR